MPIDKQLNHHCELLPAGGVYVDFVKNDYPSWHLRIQKEATSEDLEENHYLEYEGEIVWITEIEIAFCPYCGEALPNIESSVTETYGAYWHTELTKLTSSQ